MGTDGAFTPLRSETASTSLLPDELPITVYAGSPLNFVNTLSHGHGLLGPLSKRCTHRSNGIRTICSAPFDIALRLHTMNSFGISISCFFLFLLF